MNDQKNATISFKDFEWLAGSWEGEAFGGTFEEVWSPATAGSMCGTFKLISNNKVSFYEIFTITFESGRPILKLKHFNADLTGWEEKDEVISFPYIDCNKNELQFDGLIYRKTSNETMRIILRTKGADGKVADNIIDCKKSKN
ncbi:MAG: hypothetical protein GY855_11045 [candidate division Zixibacteria bacterium]|nr:hypothetical protein [candidate division Zixibacteria bacterium]